MTQASGDVNRSPDPAGRGDYLTSAVRARTPATSAATLPDEPQQPAIKESQWLSHTVEHCGHAHYAKAYVPSSYDGRPLPMMAMLHGAQQHPDDFAAGIQMNVAAEDAGFIVVYPEQSESANLLRCWNWFMRSYQARDTGEAAALAALTNELIIRFNVDRARVHVAGLPAGGRHGDQPRRHASRPIRGSRYPFRHSIRGSQRASLSVALDERWPKRDLFAKTRRARGSDAHRALIVFHGDADDTVQPVNGEQIIEMSQLLNRQATDTRVCATTRVDCESGRHAYTRDVWRDEDGSLLAERWVGRPRSWSRVVGWSS